MSTHERVSENLNRALHSAIGADEQLYLLGEDVSDPYGGAFKVTRGLSSSYPERVLSTPLSEAAITGVAGGIALSGGKAIVEMMFADFASLAFDSLLNFASKSVAMYGARLPMHMVLRAPSGGGRGYGPTHSQSLHKHFIGIPHLSLFELSPLHDNHDVLERMLTQGEPCLFFEDKTLYTRRMYRDGRIDDLFGFDYIDEERNFARIFIDGYQGSDVVLIAAGGMVERCLRAARDLFIDHEISCQIIVASRIFPIDPEPLVPVLSSADLVCVVEEGTAGGTWGSEVAHVLYGRMWDELPGRIELVHSKNSIIPTAAHLEQDVVVQTADIYRTVRSALHA
ncbi:alpha-ketoacid dehydrogenase subunit beta [Streptomyces sp. NPDC003952]